MKFKIVGSGGCVSTPKPLCQCSVCVQAREKGYPYARCGCSLYLEDLSLLVDTPEDIAVALSNVDIKAVDSILYSHADPDHTMGVRIIEQIRLEWLDYYDNIKPNNPIAIYANTEVMNDLNKIHSKYGSMLDYFDYMDIGKRHSVEDSITIDNIKISFVPVPTTKAVTIFVFENNGKKLVYAPCDCVPFADDKLLYNADVLIIGDTFIGDTLKNGRRISAEHPLREELRSFEHILDLKERLYANRLVITHIEEFWGKSYDDFVAIENEYKTIQFAYDGLTISL